MFYRVWVRNNCDGESFGNGDLSSLSDLLYLLDSGGGCDVGGLRDDNVLFRENRRGLGDVLLNNGRNHLLRREENISLASSALLSDFHGVLISLRVGTSNILDIIVADLLTVSEFLGVLAKNNALTKHWVIELFELLGGFKKVLRTRSIVPSVRITVTTLSRVRGLLLLRSAAITVLAVSLTASIGTTISSSISLTLSILSVGLATTVRVATISTAIGLASIVGLTATVSSAIAPVIATIAIAAVAMLLAAICSCLIAFTGKPLLISGVSAVDTLAVRLVNVRVV